MGTHGSFILGVITHILGVQNLHFSWFWGPRVWILNPIGRVYGIPTVDGNQKSGDHQLRLVAYSQLFMTGSYISGGAINSSTRNNQFQMDRNGDFQSFPM